MNAAALRLFVALELAAEARDELARWSAEVLGSTGLGSVTGPALALAGSGLAGSGLAGVRQVRAENLHVTLCFLGSQPAGVVDALLGACADVASLPAVQLRLGEGVWLPTRAPRVLAVGLQDAAGRLEAVQARLSGALAAGGWYEPEARRFFPHVTVGRVRRGTRVPPGALPPPAPLAFAGRRVTLYCSVLGDAGARYEALGSVGLGEASAPSEV